MKHHNITHSGTPAPARIIRHPASVLLRKSTPERSRIALPVQEGTRFVHVSDILCCEADSNYCILRFRSGGSLMIAKTLKWVEEQLPAALFIRVHARFLVATADIELLSTDYLLLTGGQEIPVSRGRRKEVGERLTGDL